MIFSFLSLLFVGFVCCTNVFSKLNIAGGGGGSFMAGTSKVDATPPLGVPLAGYNHGDRRVPLWPLPEFGPYTTWMTGNTGRLANDGIFLRALVMKDDAGTAVAMLSVDAIGSDGTLNQLAYDLAVTMGFTVPFENCMFHSSHSHSGPGAISVRIRISFFIFCKIEFCFRGSFKKR
jgi:hypothetical protein